MTRCLALLLAVLSAAAAIGQEHPVVQTGFAADKVYDFHGLDSVNTFNGNLTVTIPIGFRYPTNGGFAYGLTLAYNSKVWSYVEANNFCGAPPHNNCPPIVTRAEPSHRSNAGLGWVVSMGRIVPPENPLSSDPNGGYQTPDGAVHAFYGKLTDAGLDLDDTEQPGGFSRDNTYFRGTALGTGTRIDHADGSMHAFAKNGALLAITDQFGNSVSVRTIENSTELNNLTVCRLPAPYHLSSAWELHDTEGRKHYVCFTDKIGSKPAYPKNIYTKGTDQIGHQIIKRIVMQTPGEKQGVYEFEYVIPVDSAGNVGVRRGCHSQVRNDDQYPDVPVLDHLDLPDGSRYQFAYSPSGTGFCDEGTLKSMTLPTGGRIEYDYRYFQIPTGLCGDSGKWTSFATGVGTRRLVDIDGKTSEWTYTAEFGPNAPGTHMCGEIFDAFIISLPNPHEYQGTVITGPDGTKEKTWYAVWPYGDTSPGGYDARDFGLPFRRDKTESDAFLSKETFKAGATTPLRSNYVRYEYEPSICRGEAGDTWGILSECYDANRRADKEVTVFHDDGDMLATTTRTDFDGFGHYRSIETSGTFPGAQSRTSFTNYNPGTNPSGFRGDEFAFAKADSWLLNTFDKKVETQDGQSVKSEACYDTKGFLERTRTLKNYAKTDGTFDRDEADLLTIFTRDDSGNGTSEKYYGGDCDPDGNCTQKIPDADLCTLTEPSSPAYEIRHTYSNGVRATSRFHENGEGLSFKVLDRTIDSSGAVTCDFDPARVSTCYTYDLLGRVKSVAPAGGAVTSYVYNNAPGTIAEVVMTRFDTETVYQFDGFGRLWREKRLMPDGSTAIQQTKYDGLGRKEEVSQFEKLEGEDHLFHPSDVTRFTYDIFGRSESITAPDQSVTSFRYFGDSRKDRTSSIWTGAHQQSVTVSERYDRFERLISVTEKSGDTTAADPMGDDIVTSYTYDVGNRLTSVEMKPKEPENAAVIQARSFDYDGRGFMNSEDHPESGVTSYGSYDARGHARTRTSGGRKVRFTFDSAERLTDVAEDVSGTLKPLKKFVFGETEGTPQNGKLESATRHNDLPSAGQIDVTESFAYNGAGLVSTRTTLVERVSGASRNQIQKFEYGLTYDNLLLPRVITMPRCLLHDCGTDEALANVTNTRTAGYLTAVNDFASLTYHPTGMVETVMHNTPNKPIDVYSQRNNMARPSKITFASCGSLTPYFLPGQVLVKATSENNACGLQITWPSALVCGGATDVKYQVLRDGAPIASCLTTPKFIDRTAVKDATYKYTVIAEGPTADGGTGSCQGGLTVKRDSSDFTYKSCPTETLLTVRDVVINVGAVTEFEATLASANGPVQDEYLIFSVLGQEIGRARTNANGKAFVTAILDVEPKLYDEADSLTVTYAGGIMPAKTVTKKIYAVCTLNSFGIKPLALNIMAHAASYPIFVRTSTHCSWDPTPEWNSDFYTLNPDGEQKGTGTFNVEVQKLEGSGTRFSSVLIAGQHLRIEQSSQCSYEFDPQFAYYPAETSFAMATINVSTAPDCKWKVKTDVPWIYVDHTEEHTGPGRVEFRILDNEGINKRVGHLLIEEGEGAAAFINQEALPESICPEIHVDLQGGSVRNSSNVAIRVHATGTFLKYEWWINDRLAYTCSGCPSITLAPGQDGYPSPGEPTSFQVRIYNSCGEVTSDRVTWSNSGVNTCRVPHIGDSTFHTNAWPGDYLAANAGSKVTMFVVGDGWPDPNPVKYQWYAGFSGDRSDPITGPDGYGTKDQLEVFAQSSPTFYWVEVTNGCGANNSRTAGIYSAPPRRRRRAVSHDVDGDSKSDVIWQNPSTNQTEIWKMNGETYADKTYALPSAPTSTAKLQSIGDLDADGHPDLIWRDPQTGQNQAWMMRYTNVRDVVPLEQRADKRWTVGAVADFDDDDHDDIAWHNAVTGENEIWFHRGTDHQGTWALPSTGAGTWGIHGAGDFSGDEMPDLFLYDRATGQSQIWVINGGQRLGTFSRFDAGTDTATRIPEVTTHALPPMSDPDWVPVLVADMNGDLNRRPDILWRNVKTGENKVWIMNLFFFQEEKPATPRDTAWDVGGGGNGNSGDTSGSGTPGGGTATSLQITADPAPLGTATAVTATLKAGTNALAQRALVFLLNDAEVTRLLTDAAGEATAAINVAGMSAGTYPNAIKVRFDGDNSYSATSASTALVIQAQPVTVTWLNPAPIVYGTPLGSTQFNATASVPGTFVYSPAAGAVLNAGYQTLTLTFTPSDTSLAAVTKNAVLLVTKAPTTVTWKKPEEIAYGVPLSDEQLSATASVAGDFEYDPPAGTVLPVGTAHLLKVAFVPESPNYEGSTGSTTIDVTKGSQLIQWSNPAAILFGDPLGPAELNARVIPSGTAAAGAMTYAPPAGTILSEGVHELKVTVAETASYLGASATVDIIVRPRNVTVTWAPPAPINYGTPLSNAQLNATASMGGTFVYDPPAGTVLDAGTSTLTARFTPADPRYQPVTVSVSIEVKKVKSEIVWSRPAPIVYGTPLSATELSAVATVPGQLVFTPTLGTILNAGQHTLAAVFTPSDPRNYESASATVLLDVNRAPQVITWNAPAPIVYGTALSSTQLNATVQVVGPSPAGAITYSPAAGTILNAGPAQTLTVSVAATPNYEPATKSVTIDVLKADPKITWAKPAGIVYGTALGSGQLNATADVSGAFVYTPPAGTILDAGPAQTLAVHFTPSDTRNYNDADASVTIDVAKAKQLITWPKPAPIVYGTALSSTQLNAQIDVVGPSPAGAVTYTPPAGTVLDAGSGQTLSVAVAETPNYEPASATVTIDVRRAPLSLTVDAKSKVYGAPLPVLTGVLTGVVNNDPITATYATTATQASPAGAYPITGTLVDPNNRLVNYDVVITPSTLTVTPAPLTIAANPATKQYSDPLPVLTATFTGFVLGETPSVLIGTLSIQTTAQVLSAPGAYPITIGGLTSPNYAITYVGSTFTVTPEDARVSVISPRLVSAAASGPTTVMLAATVQDISATADAAGDADAGDIRNATVTFVDRATNATLCTAPIGLIRPSDQRTGVVTCTFTRDFGATLPASLVVGTRVAAYYTRDAAADDVTMSIVASTADFITGAGSMNIATVAGPNAPDVNSEARFELNMQYQKAGDLRGRFNLTFNRTEAGAVRKYELAVVTPMSMTIQRATGGGTATIIGTASIRDVTANTMLVAAAPVVITAIDAGEPGTSDAVSITVYNPVGGVWFASGWNGLQAVEQLLKNGNLTVVQRAK